MVRANNGTGAIDNLFAQLHKHPQTNGYLAKYWDGLCLFVGEGGMEIDNNTVERTIRPIALNRKNALFARHDAGAQNWTVIASLIETCKLTGTEPHGDRSGGLIAIANGRKRMDINKLLPALYTETV